ncbi:unnamed protein product [Rotaria magnacalcarata]|nr:unnamed protein product [Rotaria magnacalcarata]CAF1494277.1 unnamed protein product [Rotaria magnacalcarata]CAF2223852.1 unnamed protein product [Rotaria magnacalcarata]CAF4295612.1 unnamed protein product [Rotaria magnacalcarata]CAF4295981.1 unnamed protein product [Rotaria magnacalcarata]
MIDVDTEEVQIEVTSSTTSCRIIKEKRSFRKEWLFIDQYLSWLQAIDHDSTKARCKACLKTFSVHSDGKSALGKHLTSHVHKKSMKSLNNNCSVTKFITPERELDKISAAECILVFHEVKHGHSYRCQDCTVDIIRTIFELSSLAKSMSCGKTKVRAIACNILGSYFTTIIIDDLLKAPLVNSP